MCRCAQLNLAIWIGKSTVHGMERSKSYFYHFLFQNSGFVMYALILSVCLFALLAIVFYLGTITIRGQSNQVGRNLPAVLMTPFEVSKHPSLCSVLFL
jgi:hypothetical protein